MHKTIFDNDFKITGDDLKFDYQKALTKKLDSTKVDFSQNVLNEIVLWKVNRYAEFDSEFVALINTINADDTVIDDNKTRLLLSRLLRINGVQLAMASTILRFRNPHIYQIIDQRVYRIIYKNQELKINTYQSEKNIKNQIDIYLKYLKDLRNITLKLNIPFDKADRILYMADKRINKNHKLKNY